MESAIFQIKRSQGNNTPQSLANGELAYSFSSNKLYIGQTDSADATVSVEYIGGKLIVDKVANLESLMINGQGTANFGNVVVGGTFQVSNATNNSVLIAKTDGVIDFITADTGKLLQIAANGTPVFDDLNGGNY